MDITYLLLIKHSNEFSVLLKLRSIIKSLHRTAILYKVTWHRTSNYNYYKLLLSQSQNIEKCKSHWCFSSLQNTLTKKRFYKKKNNKENKYREIHFLYHSVYNLSSNKIAVLAGIFPAWVGTEVAAFWWYERPRTDSTRTLLLSSEHVIDDVVRSYRENAVLVFT